jgi:hypothetical protein
MKTTLLLQHAANIVGGTMTTTPRQANRVAAFLIRQALEEVVHAQCELLIHRLDHPVRMQSRLTVLYLFASAEVATTAAYAWFALSRACHHHAYELGPTASELRHLLGLVQGLADAEKR